MSNMEEVYRQEAIALRAQLERHKAPAPSPSLDYYAADVNDVVAAIRRRGIHPSEVEWVASYIEHLGQLIFDDE